MKIDLAKRTRIFWQNPVVTRDLRGRMRGSKSYWQQAFYLLLLGLLSIVGYGTSVGWDNGSGSNGMSAVQVQQQLQSFFYFIFFTLAALITLIAPALTAVSITMERQRQSLDLLVTTPLSASELLMGKMISSVAFLLLLLALSLPASALCVILGGATLGDVVRVYVLLAIDGLLLAALGLAVSCSVRASPAALVWSYIILIIFLFVTTVFTTTTGLFMGMRTGSLQPLAAVMVLNPFVAVYMGSQSFMLWSVSIPLWAGGAVLAFLLARLLLTIASYRLGFYGSQAIGSLRRQILLISALSIFGVVYSAFQRFGGIGRGYSPDAAPVIEGSLISLFICASLFMPSLFVPAMTNEDDPPGTPIVGSYSVNRLFQAVHSSSLPYFHLWLVCVTIATVAGAIAGGVSSSKIWETALLTAFYVSGLAFLFWGLSRLAASLVTGVTAARAISFIFFAAIAWLPIALLGLMYAGLSGDQENSSPIAWIWIFYPLLKDDGGSWTDGTARNVLLWSGTLSYFLGVIAYMPWRSVVPGGRRKKKEAPVVHNA